MAWVEIGHRLAWSMRRFTGGVYNCFNIRTRLSFNPLPNSTYEMTVVVMSIKAIST